MSRRAWALFGAVGVLWGALYLFVAIVGDELSPSALTFVRCVITSAILVPLAERRGVFRGLRRRLRAITIMAVASVVVPFLLLTYSQHYLTSSLAGMLSATVPILVAVLAMRFDRGERMNRVRAAGLAIGIAGVAVMLRVSASGDARTLVGAAMVLLASLWYAGTTLYYKHAFPRDDAVGVTAWIFLVSAVVLLVPAVATAPASMPDLSAVAATLALGIGCTAFGYLFYYQLVDAAGPGRASVVMYANPAVAAVLGALVLSESVTVKAVFGFVMVVFGAWLSTNGGGR